MKIVKNIKVPTGNICVMQGERGLIEFLSIGDYGKELNIKADFLGITREINGVPNGKVMPLTDKWVITISTQYGCSMDCTFCDVPKVGRGINATVTDINEQIIEGLKLHPEIKITKRLNIHYARMGEPTFNENVLRNAAQLKELIYPYIGDSLIHPVISTMLPKDNKKLYSFLNEWCNYKNIIFKGDAGLQFSINSTNDIQRDEMFSGNALSISDISYLSHYLPRPIGRKYALNFALADNYEVDAKKLKELFSPEDFMVKITPLHQTLSCIKNNIVTTGGYNSYVPYEKTEKELKEQGFDVIVFIPSYDEDLGMITCGNAILSGKLPSIPFKEII
jgi:23S rRNA (adenine2503-C2)-methyltransferase